MDSCVFRYPTPVLVGLHGLGTNAEDFMDLVYWVEKLNRPQNPLL